MTPLTQLLLVWIIAAILMTLLWTLQRSTRDAGVADVGWAAGLGVSAIAFGFLGGGDPSRRALVAIIASVWAFRLAWYILRDRVLSGEEDGRYQRMREHWGDKANGYLFLFFQAQALFIVIFALPMLVVAQAPRAGLDLWDWIGALIVVIAIAGESVADRQLAGFRANPNHRGKTCRVGLWRYSRHPNYFFEWLHWWGYVAMGILSPWGWLTLFGPALMLLFLFRVTGIPWTEIQAVASRGDDYRDYQKTTSVFFPWFPKENTK